MPHGQDVQTWRSNSTCFRVPFDVRGTVVKKVVSEVKFKATLNHATKDKPKYFIKSDKTDHVAIHKGSALPLLELSPKKK